MRLFSLLLLFLVSSAVVHANTAIIKINVLRGEQMVTVKVPQPQLKKIIANALAERGIASVPTCRKAELFVDAFVYQYPTEYPSVLLTIRSRTGMHYSDREHTTLFVYRPDAHIAALKKLCRRLPASIDTKKVFELKTLTALESRIMPGLVHATTHSIRKAYEKHYSNRLDWGTADPLPFAFHSFGDYLKVATDYTGIRNKIKQHGAIKLRVRIDDAGTTDIEAIRYSIKLNRKQEQRLQELVDSLPIWITDKPVEDVFIVVGLD